MVYITAPVKIRKKIQISAPLTIAKVFSDLHGYTNSREWSDYLEARATLEIDFAHKLPDQGVAVFNRTISK